MRRDSGRQFAHETGATFLIAHHTGKDTSKGSRGHSSLKDKADQEVIVSGAAILHSDGTVNYTAVAMLKTKNRNEENWGRIAFDLRKPEGFEAPVVVGSGIASGSAQASLRSRLRWLSAIEAGTTRTQDETQATGATFADIATTLGVTRQSVDGMLETLTGHGLVDIDTATRPKRVTLTAAGRTQVTQAPTQAPTQVTPATVPNAGRHRNPVGYGDLHSAPPAQGNVLDLATILGEGRAAG